MTDGPLRIAPEWLPADGVATPELAATWCRLSISVGDHVVTRVEDVPANTTRNGIFCSAYPLAEWIATNWWPLRAHVRPGRLLDRRPLSVGLARSNHVDDLRSHDIREAGDGFLWPRLLIVPEGSRTLLAWVADDAPQAGVLRYVASGRVWTAPSDTQTSLAHFVTAVIDRLHDVGVGQTFLEEEWSHVVSADADETSFCDAAAALGLDPYDISARSARAVEKVATAIGAELVPEFTAAADPQRISEDVAWVAHSLSRVSHKPGTAHRALAKLQALNLDANESGPPWEIGWRHAQQARRVMRVHMTDPIAINDLFSHRRVESADPALQALASGVSGRIEIVLGSRAGTARQRFVESRALWRSLHVIDRPYLLTTAPTFEQRVERAFAAEFLAPAGGIARLVKGRGGVVLAEEVERVARRFKVSPVVVGHQLENQLGLAVAAG